jgi:hypothetical protein
VVLFRSPMPAGVAALAGSERTPEGAWSFPGGTDVPPDRVTVTERHRARPDQDQVRAARVGEAHIIAAGRVERTRIIQTAIPAETHSRVEALLSHGPSRPLEASVETPKHLTNDELQLLLGVLLLTISLGGLALLLVLFA